MFGVLGVKGVSTGAPGAVFSAGSSLLPRARLAMAAAFQMEVDERRLLLWVPALAGAGVVFYFAADREPSAIFATALFAGLCAVAYACRAKPAAFRLAVALAALAGGVASGALRTWRVAAPVLDRVRVVKMTGWLEEVDLRRAGARYVRFLLTEFKQDMPLVIAAYNAGEGSVSKYRNSIPPYPETRMYVAKVLASYEKRTGQSLLQAGAVTVGGRVRVTFPADTPL
jgi:hypothetical protein